MQRALELARRGLGHVEPNPMVGAVIAQGSTLIAEGWHQQFGGPHAEVVALNAAAAGSAGRARGATLYVTLEPCCHHGKTPPCSDLVIRSGITRVVAAMCDPFAQVCGKGIEQLRAAGIEVVLGVMENQARLLNQPFIKRVTTQRPYVTAKWAMTLDGRLASSSGDSKWISGPRSRQLVHSLRSRMDAIIVGSGTVQADDPQLTVRLDEPTEAAPDYGRRPVRVIIDPNLTLSLQSNLARTARQVPVLLATMAAETVTQARTEKERALTDAGVEIAVIAPSSSVPNRISIDAMLAELASRGTTNVLIEGGTRTLEAFFAAQAIDALSVFLAPKLIGGPPTHAAPGPHALTLMQHALPLQDTTYTTIPPDLLITGTLRQY